MNCLECFVHAPEAERELNLRPPAAGLLEAEDIAPSMVVFVLLLLATMTFDGFMATSPWSTIESALYAVAPGGPDFKLTITTTAGLVGFAVLFIVVYRIFAGGVAAAAGHGSPTRMASVFVLSLVPIALAYHLAHYFTYLMIQGQLVIPLSSDPFGSAGTSWARPMSVPTSASSMRESPGTPRSWPSWPGTSRLSTSPMSWPCASSGTAER